MLHCFLLLNMFCLLSSVFSLMDFLFCFGCGVCCLPLTNWDDLDAWTRVDAQRTREVGLQNNVGISNSLRSTKYHYSPGRLGNRLSFGRVWRRNRHSICGRACPGRCGCCGCGRGRTGKTITLWLHNPAGRSSADLVTAGCFLGAGQSARAGGGKETGFVVAFSDSLGSGRPSR